MSTEPRRRINITLPEETLALIDRVTKESRSEFINQAVHFYATRVKKAQLKSKLKRAYLERAQEDAKIAQEWLASEDPNWE